MELPILLTDKLAPIELQLLAGCRPQSAGRGRRPWRGAQGLNKGANQAVSAGICPAGRKRSGDGIAVQQVVIPDPAPNLLLKGIELGTPFGAWRHDRRATQIFPYRIPGNPGFRAIARIDLLWVDNSRIVCTVLLPRLGHSYL